MKILPPLDVASRKKNADWDKPGSERWGSGSNTKTLTGKCGLQEDNVSGPRCYSRWGLRRSSAAPTPNPVKVKVSRVKRQGLNLTNPKLY